MTQRQVTEQDFRKPEFRDAQVADYEFRADGQLVRKDRWERAIHEIRHLVGVEGRSFEVPEVVEAVRKLSLRANAWVYMTEVGAFLELPKDGARVDVLLEDGSELKHAAYRRKANCWHWRNEEVPLCVVAWREPLEDESESPEAPL